MNRTDGRPMFADPSVMIPNGYSPHEGMAQFTCPFCGHGEFRNEEQSIPTDGRRWTFEYICTRCGRMTGLTVRGEEE